MDFEFLKSPDRYNLVITDLTMPKMPGLELARRILAVRSDLPIILATGLSGALTREEIRTQGIADLLLKPITPTMLAEAVHQALRGRLQAASVTG